jgi:hypothetical protein
MLGILLLDNSPSGHAHQAKAARFSALKALCALQPLAQSARSKPIAFQTIRFKQKGRRPDSYQPGATRQVDEEAIIQGLKARAKMVGRAFSP